MFRSRRRPQQKVKWDNEKSLVTVIFTDRWYSFHTDIPYFYIENKDYQVISIQHYF